MAWNEPGGPNGNAPGNKNSDRGSGQNPWGKRPQQGPPDLDDLLRNFKRKLSALFGGSGSGSGGRSGGTGGASESGGIGVGVIILAFVAIWAATGVYQVDQAERAVILRFGKFSKITQPGLNWRFPRPIEREIKVNIERTDSVSDQARMLTADENMVDIDLGVQFRRADPKAYVFNVKDPEATLQEVSESAIRDVIGRSKLDDVLKAGRQKIAEDARILIQELLKTYEVGIEVTSVNLPDVKVPEQVKAAQEDAIKAGKDKERFALEAQTNANDILPKARGDAASMLQDAQAYRARKTAESEGDAARFSKLLAEYERAPGVTRQRLYLETVESVLSQSKKVIIDAKGGNNMFYVPLDKLVEQARGAPRDSTVVTRAPTTTAAGVNATDSADDRRARGTR